MNKISIELAEINVQDFYGIQNKNLEYIIQQFPKLKIVARGRKVSAIGPDDELVKFEQRINAILDHIHHFNRLTETDLEYLFEENPLSPQKIAPDDTIIHGLNGTIIKALTPNQRKLVDAVYNKDMVFATGPAGTGKTYTSVALAVKALKNKQVKRIILTRPAVEAGESLGFLPGDLKEKLDPYLQPLYDALRDMIHFDKLASYIEKGVIEIAPLAFMRGRTLDNAFVILDEAQNTTHSQMKMFLTRMGKNAKFIITGDPGQIDLPRKQKSGLKEAMAILKNVPDIAFVQLDGKDVVRHKIVKQIIDAYQEYEK
ncbi:PhoH family protein [Ornithobacterium rhinotracheale]|uniref:PhoH family protein n=1 Tax=Ornithobacterium rhinotracheale TaxID=28251 RepID=UPI00129D0E48|nr:PhoH family protein [Ornithobacterium rhinotracheale]MRI63554.1 PhoH family protein [Ornithobacterium rhinotracheale]MRJ08462.1 PhoH family protein [Ornithobacterium rhinotracheale]UOH76737.1 PhoH family protein [Ornithobacterium rhinotracheale]